MNEMPFPKPPPADPLPLDVWLDQTDRAEVGRESFFRGRDTEYDVFRRAVNSLRAGRVGGGTMIFQGAPGAGKSALMNECMEAVRHHSTPEDRWIAVSISPGFLDSPLDVIEAMVNAARTESERLQKLVSETPEEKLLVDLLTLGKKFGEELAKRGGGIFGIKVGGSKDEKVTTIGRTLGRAAPLLKKFRIVVFVDEAQNTPITKTTRAVMDCLHRDPQGIPLVAAFFGLSDTKQVLSQCGLSRLSRGRLMNLEPLPLDEAADSIRDVFDAYGFTGTPEDRTAWVGRLAELSQGWPQHINCVSVAAGSVIRDNGGMFDANRLLEAITLAEEYMKEYYEGRLDAGSCDPWVYQQLALAMKEKGKALSRLEIGPLTELARAEKSQTLNEFLTDALHAGLLAPERSSSSRYRIPIPSLGDYLRALEEDLPPQFQK